MERETRYGKLTVLSWDEVRDSHNRKCVMCRCDCGRERLVSEYHLLQGNIKSCGMKCREVAKRVLNRVVDHPAHERWHGMMQRCNNKDNKDYHKYGGRGIKVHPDFHDFWTFATYIGEPPSDKHQIDRIDNNRDYEPGNVRWATAKEQANNRRSNVFLEFNGRRMTITQWAEELGVGVTTIHWRLAAGWAIEKVLSLKDYRGGKK